MRTNYVQFGSPQFRLLSDSQKEELHLAVLHILEKTGVFFDCQEAIDILTDMQAATTANDTLKNAKIINGKTQILG